MVAYDGYNGTMLWKYKLPEGMMVHRNVFIATPDVLFVGDDQSCKLIDTQTGDIQDEIRPARGYRRRYLLEMDGAAGRRSLRRGRRAGDEG